MNRGRTSSNPDLDFTDLKEMPDEYDQYSDQYSEQYGEFPPSEKEMVGGDNEHAGRAGGSAATAAFSAEQQEIVDVMEQVCLIY